MVLWFLFSCVLRGWWCVSCMHVIIIIIIIIIIIANVIVITIIDIRSVF